MIATNVVLDIALLETYKEGIEIRCVDDFKRRCYLVLTVLMVDYEEQVLITGVKANMQCSICHFLPKKKERVTKKWEFRTHELTWEQIKRQRNNPAVQRVRTADEWLYPRESFAWDHSYVNIHAILLSDILHQLYKGVVTNLVSWITKTIVEVSGSQLLAKKRGHNGLLRLVQTSKVFQLDERFRNVLPFLHLKLFQHYSKVVQWTGNEQKAMVKQLVIAATPLLIQNAPKAIHCARAILNFTMLAQYVSHDDETLRYMEHALYRLEKTKIAFEHHWPIDSKLCRPTFNYLKFYAVTHFALCIRDYGSAVNYDTAHSKAAHKYLLKAFYNKTNKKEYDAQIWQHNVRHTNVIAMKDVIILKKALKKEGQLVVRNANKIALAEFGRTLSPMDLDGKYMWAISNVDIDAARDLGLTGIKKHWRLAGLIEKEVNRLHKN